MPLILFNKPFRVLSQFRNDGDRATLSDFVREPAVYPAGRLDFDSEGLLLLTDDGALQARISSPRSKLWKTYLVQVEGEPARTQLDALRSGAMLKDGPAVARQVELASQPDWLWPRVPPVRFRANIPTAWLRLSIDEGRNRQVRRMTAAVGLPTLRLVRECVGPWSIEGLPPGQSLALDTERGWRELKAWRQPVA